MFAGLFADADGSAASLFGSSSAFKRPGFSQDARNSADRAPEPSHKRRKQSVEEPHGKQTTGPETVPETLARPAQDGAGQFRSRVTRAGSTQPAGQSVQPRKRSRSDGSAQEAQQKSARSIFSPQAESVNNAERREEPERLERTLFVGNLVPDIQRKRLKKTFSRFGEVETVRLRSVAVKPDSKKPRRAAIIAGEVVTGQSAHAYVVFKDSASIQAALAYNMEELDGRHVRVDKVSPPGESTAVKYQPGRSVFVGNLAFDVQDEVIISFFNDEIADPSLPRPVTAVRAVRDAGTGVGKGFAFVEFQTKAAAQVALTLNGQKLEGRPLRVTRISSSLPGHSEGPVRTAKRAAGHSAPLSTSSVSGQRPGSKGMRHKYEAQQPRDAAWQGFRTKGAGKSARAGAGKAPRRSANLSEPKGSGARSASPKDRAFHKSGGSRAGSKRPAVQARKAAQSAPGNI